MVTKVRTLDFLPEVFRTDSNAQFLAATLDQLVQQPDLRRVEGFIGQNFGYGIDSTDRYVVEPTQTRQNYQLDPSVIFLKPETQDAKDFINYPGILNALTNNGAITDNNNRLFESEYYSWDSFADLDKIVNYSQYYWLPYGPDSVSVSTNTVYLTNNYTIVYSDTGYTVDNSINKNPSITLLRGGTYTFEVNQSSNFWIQGVPGVTGFAPDSNISSRDVFGVSANNGTNNGTITFIVPEKTAQQQYDLPGNNSVDLVTTLQYIDINGKTTTEIGNIDGVTQLNGKTLMFYNNGLLNSQITFYSISVDSNTNIVTLTSSSAIPNQEKIIVSSGTTYAGRTFYRDNTGTIQLIPYLSAVLDTLYYQDASNPLAVGVINLVENNTSNSIDIDQILGKKNYTSQNGVTFINGLKVLFQGTTVPSSYQNNEYYVEGVGTAINLLLVNDYQSVESNDPGTYYPWDYYYWDVKEWDQSSDVPLYPDYITINRNSQDRNAWSRSNRWFNKQVIDATLIYNGETSTTDNLPSIRAQRPIIEFYGNLGLFNSGTKSLGFVNLFDNTTTDAFTEVVGQSSYEVDGQPLIDGQTVIFNADTNLTVRDTIYKVSFAPVGVLNAQVITLNPVTSAANNEQVAILSGTSFESTTWRYNSISTGWIQCQQKSTVNQAPLFDIYDINGISLSDQDYYNGSTFAGTKLFSYTVGTGSSDPILGFPISYSSSTSIGDINFTVNLNQDTFNYQQNNNVLNENINIGYVYDYITATDFIQRTGWVTAFTPSFQSQVFQFTVDQETQSRFTCDVVVKTDTIIDPHHVYVNDVSLDDDTAYSHVIDLNNNTTTIILSTPAIRGDKVTVTLLSDQVSRTGYYEIPSNLQNNPFNTDITTVNVGDIKNQYDTIFENTVGVTGPVFGPNNVYNLGNLNKYGTAIIQNSASLVLPGVFLRKPGLNLFEALQFNSDQYTNFKTTLVNLTDQNDFTIYTTPATMLDTIIYQISSTKNSSNSFFWSDMLYSGSPYRTNSYPINGTLTTITLPLYRLYDFTSANYYGLGIYITSQVNGQSVTTQLISGIDYIVSDISPLVEINYNITAGSTITINEYNQTYGSYCPNTPTKLGLYPSFVPGVILDNTYTTPTYFILGHDGSYTKLYGNYVNGQLSDFRDKVLLEFETRIYNNLKVSGDIPLPADEVIPGQFRTTDYSQSEILDIYRTNFLKWVGQNRIDYKTQQYNRANKFSYNYNQSTNILNNELLKQGYWRGIYNWFYDTSNPAAAPWEMLGLTSEPDWWTDRYGPAPYTSDNTYMWQEISEGFVWNNGDSYINPFKIRSQLLDVLPVDAEGTLLPPLPVVVGNYDTYVFERNWVVGDQGPAETSYLRSSSYPFDLMRILALTKPAKFFNLNVDRDLYKFNSDFNQYLYNNRGHLNPRDIIVYGNGVSKASYINWVVDYINQRGVDGTDEITTTLKNLDVRLTYNLAAFSSKNYLKFLIEKSTPNTQNNTLLIPDNSYSVLLYDNVPEDKIVYSSVIIQKTEKGYTVWGNGLSNPFFTVAVPKPGVNDIITVNSLTVNVSSDFFQDKTVTIPYGTLYFTVQGVSEFLTAYGKYLVDQGMLFNYVVDTVSYNWQQMIREFLHWAEQQWEVGSTISLNPAAKITTVNRPGLVVQPLTIQQENFILNQNLIPLQAQNTAIIRENESFTVSVLSEGDTVAFTNLNLASMEHAVVFDNYTIFNDTIYDLTTGLRQQRLLLQGYKSGEWNGYFNASGFIINEDNIQEWVPNVKYASGKIVTYKNQYWVANKLIQPQAEFATEQWTQTNYNKLKSGLLPNPSTNAYESLFYYDSTRPNFENDEDLLSFSLIGYRPRQYLTNAELSDITQIGVYKNIIKEKGTNLIANAFKSANLLQGQIDYSVKENWAIKTSTFGSVSNSNFVECLLNQSQLTGNPTLLGFSVNGDVSGVQQTVMLNQLINWNMPPTSANFLPPYDTEYYNERGLPSAGYVNLNDVKFKAYEYEDLNFNSININTLNRGENIWVANYRGSWNVFTPQSVNTQVVNVINNLNGTVSVTFAKNPNLSKNDPIAIFQFDARVDGFYQVVSVDSLTSVTIKLILDNTVLNIQSTGLAFKLVSRRFAQASDQVYSTVVNSEYYTKKSWIDRDTDNQWAVWTSGPEFSGTAVNLDTNLSEFGGSVAYSTEIGYVGASVDDGTIYRRYTDSDGQEETQIISYPGTQFGFAMVAVGDYLYVSDPANNRVYIYSINYPSNFLTLASTIDQQSTGQIAVSIDRQWLYISNVDNKTVGVWALGTSGGYSYVTQITGPNSADGFGTSIATSIDGVKLVVGAPYENLVTGISSELTDSGAAYVYSRSVQRFMSNGTSTTYTVNGIIPNGIADVFVDDVLQTTGVAVNSGGSIVFFVPPQVGSIIEVSYGEMNLITKLLSKNPIVGGNFGISVDTNKYGAQILVGCPNELQSIDLTSNVKGAVYRFTNGGQQYGSVVGQVNGSTSGYIFVDGFKVNYNGNASQIAQSINTQTPTNIISVANGDILQIGIISDTVDTVNNIIDITGPESNVLNLGLKLYTNTQVIVNPNLPSTGSFGSTMSMGERDNLVISDPTAAVFAETTFDYSDVDPTQCSPVTDRNYTIFDHGATVFIDSFDDTGVVYEFDYLPAADESIINPGQYVFGQYIQTVDRTDIGVNPRFGTSVVNNDGIIVVGAPGWYLNSGEIFAYIDYCTTSSWNINKKPLPMVSVEKLNNISIYDVVTNETLDYLDYIDPVQGKLLGAVETNLDYISSSDPATYSDGIVWTYDKVGTTWLDTTSLRMLNYNQPSVTYNASNWGKAFPGSTADVYTWIISSFPPIQYFGNGFVVDFNRFTTTQRLDRSTNTIVVDYYFWVKNYSLIPEGKTLSPLTVSQYILNPLSSGISFLAAITTNIVSLFNSENSIRDESSALHIGYSIGNTPDQKHESWTLIQENNESDFLTGFPTSNRPDPIGLYAKYLDSFAGQNLQGVYIPNPRLPLLTRTGIDYSQSMFINRPLALQNYIQYANQVLIKFPIAETRNLYFLNTEGDGYDTKNYWSYADWWATGYSSDTKIVLEVNTVTDLQTLQPNQILPGTEQIVVGLADGIIVKVKSNAQGNSETWTWNEFTGWIRIGLQNGTIQISELLYSTPINWDIGSYDIGLYDDTVYQETYWIIRWLNEQAYIENLLIERNNSLILMFNYIQSESMEQQNYLDWLNKTSLVDVSHRVRELLPYKKFQRDNQEFLSGYLNEVKPFHVKIKDFLYVYPGQDEFLGDITDFDLPAKYSSSKGQFETPELVYTTPDLYSPEYLPTDEIWQSPEYTQWFNNYGLSISNENNLYNVTSLTASITALDTFIPVENTYGLPNAGFIYIGEEKISYGNVDTFNNILFNVVRGVESTAVPHLINSSVSAILPAVIVLDKGRGYSTPPVITVSIDTSVYPAPRTIAQLSPITILDTLSSVQVIDGGSGYAVQPQINIESSPISYNFSSINVNLVLNTITIANHGFLTGDPVKYTVGTNTTEPLGLTSGDYYYIRVINSNTIALYYSLIAAFNIDRVGLTDTNRVQLKTQGIGTANTLAVTARAALLTSSQPVREITTTIKFDRTSYGSLITEWISLTIYAGELVDPAATEAEFIITSVINPGTVTAAVVVGLDYQNTTVSPGQLNGQQITAYQSGLTDPTNYYVKVITTELVQLYYDPLFNYPVRFADFDYSINDLLVLEFPFTFNQSLVTHAGKLYQCTVSNNDLIFDYSKWQQIYSDNSILNAADRIAAFYRPTANMTGRDLRQLMNGIVYPNATTLGAPFNYNLGLLYDSAEFEYSSWDVNSTNQADTELRSPAFNYNELTNPTVYDVQGGSFKDGYGPEELVPGLVTDFLELKVTTDPETLAPGNYLDFRIQVDKFGQGSVYNTNPYTQTFLTEDFVSTNSITDILHVDDASKLVATIVEPITTDSNGVAYILSVAQFMTAYPILSIPNTFTFEYVNYNDIKLTISGITSPTTLYVTISEGNMLLVNSEYIQFTNIDLATNTVSGLLRGRKGTITNEFIEAGTIIQSVLERDKLVPNPVQYINSDEYYYKWWYDPAVGGGFLSNPLSDCTTIPALFLRRITPIY